MPQAGPETTRATASWRRREQALRVIPTTKPGTLLRTSITNRNAVDEVKTVLGLS